MNLDTSVWLFVSIEIVIILSKLLKYDYGFFFLIILSIYLFLAVLGLHCCMGFSLIAVHRLLTAVASLVAEHGL